MTSAGGVITGFDASITVTFITEFEVLPTRSVAVIVTGVIPRLIIVPAAGTCDVIMLPEDVQLSENVAAIAGIVAWHTAFAFKTGGAGSVITGAVLSETVTLKEHVAVFPVASVAMKVLVVVPMGNTDPLPRPAVCVVVTKQLSVPTGVT
jgi:hypothetical protein